MVGAELPVFTERELAVMSVTSLRYLGKGNLAIARILALEVEFVDNVTAQMSLVEDFAPTLIEREAT